MQILALHLEIEGYIPLLLYGIVFIRRIGDFNGESQVAYETELSGTQTAVFTEI